VTEIGFVSELPGKVNGAEVILLSLPMLAWIRAGW